MRQTLKHAHDMFMDYRYCVLDLDLIAAFQMFLYQLLNEHTNKYTCPQYIQPNTQTDDDTNCSQPCRLTDHRRLLYSATCNLEP